MLPSTGLSLNADMDLGLHRVFDDEGRKGRF